jgi:hypothetical protein
VGSPTSFYGTLLKAGALEAFKDELFSGGRGGEAFQSFRTSNWPTT